MVQEKLNLINQKFNKLLIISETTAPKNRKDQNSTFYLCLCECGKQTTVRGSALIAGQIKSCGCLKNARKYNSNLIGQKFGKLTVIEQVSHPPNLKPSSHIYFECQCECGNKKTISNYALIHGSTKSCGCLGGMKVFRDLTGQTLGNFFVIKRIPSPPSYKNKNSKSAFFLCRCVCGKEIPIRGAVLSSGKIQSCGCLNKFTNQEEVKISSFEKYFMQYNDGDLTKENFSLFTQLPCFYCGVAPYNLQNKHNYNPKSSQFAKENGDIIVNGLDRISSNGLHTYDNIVPCCQICNSFKLAINYEDVIRHIPKLLDLFEIVKIDKLHKIQDQLNGIDLSKYPQNIHPLSIIFPIKINSKKRQSYISDIIYKWRHRKENNGFRKTTDLNDAQIAELLLAKCCYCGEETNINNRKLNQIDRLNNTLGYTFDNSVSACKNCNSAKNILSIEEFAFWVKRIKSNFHNLPKTEQEVKSLINSGYLFQQIQKLNIINYYQLIKIINNNQNHLLHIK